MGLKILLGCEESQEVTKAFRERGFEAYSCDLQDCPTDQSKEVRLFRELQSNGKYLGRLSFTKTTY